ncbi:DUF1672 family protein [Paraliobacillus ryukyuensis]|uniref:DUF1672 family protein n=1 Tax=Paraliobacillus ryukyuensis TaxID=200904 RepID=UPI001FEA26CD|nr:DUF1672 family protein [Paraliobacillus ryukyuensis]
MVEGINSSNESEENSASEDHNDNQSNPDDVYVPVQEYTGDGYTLANGKETDLIANENRDVVEDAVKQFFQEEYKTEVKVHQIVGNVDGATVFVESVGEPHFYTYAIVPIDKANESIRTDKVWSQEAAVEDAISAGIYGKVQEEKFHNLTTLIENVAKQYNLVGLQDEAISVGANLYSNEYYFTSIFDEEPFIKVLNNYLDDPNQTINEWNKMLNIKKLDPNSIGITINLYMANEGADPDREAFDQLVKTIEKAKNIPKGNYAIFLHDNLINKKRASGSKDNSLRKSTPEEIIKE